MSTIDAAAEPQKQPGVKASASTDDSRWDRVKRNCETIDKIFGIFKSAGLLAAGLWAYWYAWAGASHTSFQFAEANSSMIKLIATTEAPKLKRAYLREFDMSFGALPIEPVTLRLVSDNEPRTWAVVPPDEPVLVRLTVDRLRGQCRHKALSGQPDRYTKQEIIDRIKGKNIMITIDVQESDDKGAQRHRITQIVPASALDLFIDNFLPEHIPEKTSC